MDKEIESLVPKAELLYMERCGHLPILEKPGDFYSILRTFLEKKRPR